MNDSDHDPLREKLPALPREINPPRDLWPAIRAELASTALASASTSARPSRPLGVWFNRIGLAAAALVVVSTAVFWVRRPREAGWNVTSLSGAPRVDARPLAGEGTWRTGQWLETDAASRAKLAIGNIGEVRLEPNSRLRLLGTAAKDHRLELARGTLHALIWAPPRIFFVETPSATAVDLGCAYTLTVDDAGVGALRVTSGYVALEHGGHESLIPAGMTCLTRVGAAPGTPFSEKTSAALRAALERFDFDRGGDPALTEVLALAASGDEITLWHLLGRVDETQRGPVFEKLAGLHALPEGVTRAEILSGDKTKLKEWGRELGLPNL